MSTAKVLAFRLSRPQYERAALLLGRLGRVPGHPLKPIDYRVLSFLVHQQPGYTAFHRTLGDELDGLGHDAVHDALHRLRDAGLVVWDLIPPQHYLPWGRKSDTKVNQYWITPAMVEALEAEWARRLAGAQARRARFLTPVQPSPVTAHETSSSGSDQTPDPKAPPTPSPESEPVTRWGDVINAIVAAFDVLRLRPACGPRERRAVSNRLHEGCTADELQDAVEGARRSDRLRSPRIRDPFAIVFANAPAVRQFAAEGRQECSQPSGVQENPAPTISRAPVKLRLVTAIRPALPVKMRPPAPVPAYLEGWMKRLEGHQNLREDK